MAIDFNTEFPISALKLDTTPEQRELYRKFFFKTEEPEAPESGETEKPK